jgi:hypothetical protein
MLGVGIYRWQLVLVMEERAVEALSRLETLEEEIF